LNENGALCRPATVGSRNLGVGRCPRVPSQPVQPQGIMDMEHKQNGGIENHERSIDSFLGAPERKLLTWLCAHMPRWASPDLMTGLAVVGALVIAAGYALTNVEPAFLWLASFGLVLHWLGDSLDGSLARYRHIERPRYGYFVDHVIDALSVFLIGFGIGLSPYVRMDVALLTLSSYLLILILVFLRTSVTGEFRMAYFQIGSTEIRLVLILANGLVYSVGNPLVATPIGDLALYDVIGVILSVLFLLAFIIVVVSFSRTLARQESTSKS
jgi:archaetidylinositol phosphate synthase